LPKQAELELSTALLTGERGTVNQYAGTEPREQTTTARGLIVSSRPRLANIRSRR
jgi:hypothetical protein